MDLVLFVCGSLALFRAVEEYAFLNKGKSIQEGEGIEKV